MSTSDSMASSTSGSGLTIPDNLVPYLTGELKDDSSVQDAVFKVNIAFAVLVAIAIGLRMVVRFGIIRAAGLDDGMSLFVDKLQYNAQS